jgi:RNA polymerase sigma factor (sigma-70 family)
MTPPRDEDARLAFERIFATTRRDLLAYAIRRSGSVEDAADVLAETYLIAWQKLDEIPPAGETRLWLFGVARKVLLRRATRQRALYVLVERLAGELRDAAIVSEPEEDERAPALEAALALLPEPQREVLLLTAWEGLTPKQIAVVTATPVNLVRVRLHRARKRLRRELDPLDPEGKHWTFHCPRPPRRQHLGPAEETCAAD